jgi:hypothetical protein
MATFWWCAQKKGGAGHQGLGRGAHGTRRVATHGCRRRSARGRSDGQGCKRTGAHGRGRTEQGRRWALQEEQGDEEKLGPALRAVLFSRGRVRAGARSQKKKEGPRIYRSAEICNLASRVEDAHRAGTRS